VQRPSLFKSEGAPATTARNRSVTARMANTENGSDVQASSRPFSVRLMSSFVGPAFQSPRRLHDELSRVVSSH
jgi:hypothetical protein